MLFQHNSKPGISRGKKLKSQIIVKELKLNKQNTDPHSPKWISVNFLFDTLNLEQEKVEKSQKSSNNTFWTFESSGPKIQNLFNYNNSFNTKTWFPQHLVRVFFQNVWLYI